MPISQTLPGGHLTNEHCSEGLVALAALAALDLARAAHLALNDLMPKMALAFNGVASLGMVKETEIFLILLEIHCQEL
jgi:hypothetical protein